MPTQPTTNNLEGWEERLEEGFYKEFGHFHAPCNLEDTPKSETDDWEILYYFKQFISDLRKHDMEELIKIIKDNGFSHEKIVEYKRPSVKQLIKEYFNN